MLSKIATSFVDPQWRNSLSAIDCSQNRPRLDQLSHPRCVSPCMHPSIHSFSSPSPSILYTLSRPAIASTLHHHHRHSLIDTTTNQPHSMSARAKIIKPAGVNPDELEMQVAQAVFDLENGSADLKADLRPLQFTAAKEVGLSLVVAAAA